MYFDKPHINPTMRHEYCIREWCANNKLIHYICLGVQCSAMFTECRIIVRQPHYLNTKCKQWMSKINTLCNVSKENNVHYHPALS